MFDHYRREIAEALSLSPSASWDAVLLAFRAHMAREKAAEAMRAAELDKRKAEFARLMGEASASAQGDTLCAWHPAGEGRTMMLAGRYGADVLLNGRYFLCQIHDRVSRCLVWMEEAEAGSRVQAERRCEAVLAETLAADDNAARLLGLRPRERQ